MQAVNTGKVGILDTYITILKANGRPAELGNLMEELLKWYPKNAVYHLLIRHGAEKTYQDGTGRNLISLAITYNDIMLEDITSLDTYAEQERLAMITLLVQEGMDINQGDYMGRTPLHYAIGENNPTIASLLLKLGANPNQQDVYQKSPLQYATEKRYKELVTILSRAGGNTAQEFVQDADAGNIAPASVGRKISF